MFYVYLLQSEKDSKQIYYGQTTDLKRRFSEHNAGENKSTKRYCPWKLMYYEAYSTHSMALAREKQLKLYGKARTALKKRLNLI